MVKSKTKWKGFKRIFGKPSSSGPKPVEPGQQDVMDLDPNEEESFVVEPIAKNVYLFKPTQKETFEVDSSQEEPIDPEPEPEENYNFVIEPTKEYKILGLESDATDAEIKKRYRDLVKQNHPDAGGDPKDFMKIRKAYTTIMEARNGD